MKHKKITIIISLSFLASSAFYQKGTVIDYNAIFLERICKERIDDLRDSSDYKEHR